jgi:hypothetical protein
LYRYFLERVAAAFRDALIMSAGSIPALLSGHSKKYLAPSGKSPAYIQHRKN